MEGAMAITRRRCVILAATVMFLLGSGLTNHARADGGGGGGGSARENQPRSKPEDPDYTAGVRAIKSEKFADAIPLLQRVVGRDPRNADAFNWLAYATRRNGNPAGSLPLYEKALTIDPKHRGAHEYIGEAYLQVNRPEEAERHLKRLSELCLSQCSEYKDLQRAFTQYRASR
jgi:tetratricopeptide (TPR) repeat protein